MDGVGCQIGSSGSPAGLSVRPASGGSIPVMTMLLNELGIHATVFAFCMNDENLHAPNEFFRLSNFRTGQTAYAKLLERLGR